MRPCDYLFRKKKDIGQEKVFFARRQSERDELADGARMLKEIISASDGNICYPIRIFSAKELTEAADHVLQDRYGIRIYRGSYHGRQILIKEYVEWTANCRKCIFNEISIVTQLNHRNVMRLLGCCFELQWPILVFESVVSTLHNSFGQKNLPCSISWENRLRIGIEVAYAVTYLHTAKPRTIVHGLIGMSSILLDEHCRPKLFEFECSVAIPLGKTQVKMDDNVGTFGWVDPYFAATKFVTEKTDVYGFGWLLLALLCGKCLSQIFDESIPQKLEILAEAFWKRGSLPDATVCQLVLDATVANELEKEEVVKFILDSHVSTMDGRKLEQSKAWMDVACRCISFEPDQRPTMKEVAQLLRQIERYQLPLPPHPSSILAQRLLGSSFFSLI